MAEIRKRTRFVRVWEGNKVKPLVVYVGSRQGATGTTRGKTCAAAGPKEWRTIGDFARVTQIRHNRRVQRSLSRGDGSGWVVQVNVNPRGGVPKHSVPSARVTRAGVAGDRQAHPGVHGGPQRAVCLFSLERIEGLRAEGHPIRPGSTGENLTLAGLDWDCIEPGRRLQVGDEVLLEIASYTVPCEQIRHSLLDERFPRLSQRLHPGWSRAYARVLREGTVHAGDAVSLLPSPREPSDTASL